MARRRPVDLPLHALECPHCKGELALWKGVGKTRVGYKCLGCHCRWNHTRRLVRWGRRCPRYVRA